VGRGIAAGFTGPGFAAVAPVFAGGGTSPGGSAPPGPSGSSNWTSVPGPNGAVVFEMNTAWHGAVGQAADVLTLTIVMSFIVFAAAAEIVYWASSAPVLASQTKS